MSDAELRRQRLAAQGLRHPFAPDAEGVVRGALAVQSQEYLPAQWGLAQRVAPGARPVAAEVAAAIDDGRVLRTHVLRPTWHFVLPEDAAWLIELTAARVHAPMRVHYRTHGLEGEGARRALDAIAAAVAGGHRTLAELGEAMSAAGFPSSGLGFTSALMLAELERVVISGASRGAQRSWAAFDERVPPAPLPDRDEALVRLATRFLASRAPASDRDLAAWSGLTLGEVRRGLAAAADAGAIEPCTVGEAAMWATAAAQEAVAAAEAAGEPASPRIDLVQAYDEYIMGYAPPRRFLLAPGVDVVAEFPLHAVLADGVMVGRWAVKTSAKRGELRVVPFRRLAAAERRDLERAAGELAAFLGVPLDLDVEAPAPAPPSAPSRR